jgi:hypothetical protein
MKRINFKNFFTFKLKFMHYVYLQIMNKFGMKIDVGIKNLKLHIFEYRFIFVCLLCLYFLVLCLSRRLFALLYVHVPIHFNRIQNMFLNYSLHSLIVFVINGRYTTTQLRNLCNVNIGYIDPNLCNDLELFYLFFHVVVTNHP